MKDPLTNDIIVGEVEFYFVKKDNSDFKNETICSPDDVNELYEENLDKLVNKEELFFKGNFIGTDFSYATSNDFRNIFEENAIDKEFIGINLPNRNGAQEGESNNYSRFAN